MRLLTIHGVIPGIAKYLLLVQQYLEEFQIHSTGASNQLSTKPKADHPSFHEAHEKTAFTPHIHLTSHSRL